MNDDDDDDDGRGESLFVCPKEQHSELLVPLCPQRDVEVQLNIKVNPKPWIRNPKIP